MTATSVDLRESLLRYAARWHAAAPPRHQVASPLGGWLLLALVSSCASGRARAQLVQALGMDAEEAAPAAAELLSEPHPLVATAAAAWHRPGFRTGSLSAWLQGLPAAVETGEMPTQHELDAWTARRTGGLITSFPVQLDPAVVLLLCSVLATRVSWEVPFEVAPAAALGAGSPWSGRLDGVLRAPRHPGHMQFVAATDRAGDVAVHAARASGGVLVTSVAAAPDLPAGDVLAAAHQVAVRLATGAPLARRSLFDLSLGEGPMWTITEQVTVAAGLDGRDERYSTVLPAWSARSEHDLTHAPELGFPAAAAALAELMGMGEYRSEAKQAAMARYTRVGFQAAAVTGLAVATSAPVRRQGLLRHARLRFGHPYAVVAVAADETPREFGEGAKRSLWHGLPVFSAWVAEPQDVQDRDITAVRQEAADRERPGR